MPVPPDQKNRRRRPQFLTPPIRSYTLLSTYKVNNDGGWGMKWELDLWYELWDRAGSQGLDTWYELPNEGSEGRSVGRATDAEGLDEIPPEGA